MANFVREAGEQMMSREEIWRSFVDAYDIDVPADAIENELAYLDLAMRHNMQYDRLTGGDMHLFPGREIAAQEDELRAAALFEAKAPLVLKRIIAEQALTATYDELEAEAIAMAERQGSTLEMVKKFFGDDLKMLERDVLERKAIDWACEQAR